MLVRLANGSVKKASQIDCFIIAFVILFFVETMIYFIIFGPDIFYALILGRMGSGWILSLFVVPPFLWTILICSMHAYSDLAKILESLTEEESTAPNQQPYQHPGTFQANPQMV